MIKKLILENAKYHNKDLTLIDIDFSKAYDSTEKFAKEFNAVVIFTNIYKVKRGYYELQYDVITEQPNEEEFGYISKTHTEMLEKVIQEQPEFWLWSHKRWKHKRPEDEILH